MKVLITGASGGLGSTVVETFVKAGAHVYGVARSWKHVPEGMTPVSADGTTPEGAAKAAAETGGVDILVHLLGGFAGGDPIASTSDAIWNQMISMNLSSAFYAFRSVLPHMLEQKRGRIVAISSQAALAPSPNYAAYGVSKAGLVYLVKTLAAEVKDSGITANCILPGTLDTEANRKAMPDADFSKWVTPRSIADLLVELTMGAKQGSTGEAISI